MHTLIRAGLVVDGTGAEGRVADVLISNGVVAEIGVDLDAPEGAEVIDAEGCWVTPGFIDCTPTTTPSSSSTRRSANRCDTASRRC